MLVSTTPAISIEGDRKCAKIWHMHCFAVSESPRHSQGMGLTAVLTCTFPAALPRNGTKTLQRTERTKTNIPLDVNNCLQIHKLTYYKKGNIETLEGNWIPVPKQPGNCGFGTTKLTRRSLESSFPGIISRNEKNTDNPKSTNREISKITKKIVI